MPDQFSKRLNVTGTHLVCVEKHVKTLNEIFGVVYTFTSGITLVRGYLKYFNVLVKVFNGVFLLYVSIFFVESFEDLCIRNRLSYITKFIYC